MDYDPEAMNAFCNPRSVAIVGVSRRTGPGAFNILENLIGYGYTGRVYPVNPKADRIHGLACYPRAQALPEAPDLAIVTLPRELLPGVIRDGCERGIRHFTLVPQGLAEADATGAAIQDEFMAVAREFGARILGPNTLGTVNAFDGFTSSFMPLDRPADPLGAGIICQTGLFLATDLGPTTGIGLGIDVGNQVDIGFPDALRFLGDDPRLGVVCLHMEGLRPGEGRLFLEVARDVGRRKPVLVYKTARSEVGRRTAGSHTGSLAGSQLVYEAALRDAGVILLEDVEDMDDTVKTFLFCPSIRGRRVFIITVSGGGGIMAADACEDRGLELATLSPESRRALGELYPTWMVPGNPLDVWPATIGKDYMSVFATCFGVVAKDPNVDGIVCVGGAYTGSSEGLGGLISLAAEQRDKPVVWWVHGRHAQPLTAKAEASRRVAAYPSADRAVRALGRLAAYPIGCRRETGPVVERPPGMAVDEGVAIVRVPAPRRDRVTVATPRDDGRLGVLAGPAGGAEAFGLLEAYGLPVARWRIAADLEAAVQAANELGYPVVLKAAAPGLLHKTELGAVHLNLLTSEAVIEAGRDITRRLAENAGGVPLLVQEFLPGGHEVIVGGRRDPHFGPIVLFGLGGVFAEILRDVALGLAPLSPEQARSLMERTRGCAVLRGARGQPPSDSEAVAQTLSRVSWLLAGHPEIAELDLNPVKVFATGQGCRVIDARILVG